MEIFLEVEQLLASEKELGSVYTYSQLLSEKLFSYEEEVQIQCTYNLFILRYTVYDICTVCTFKIGTCAVSCFKSFFINNHDALRAHPYQNTFQRYAQEQAIKRFRHQHYA
jgi:hypothetical protein